MRKDNRQCTRQHKKICRGAFKVFKKQGCGSSTDAKEDKLSMAGANGYRA